MSTELRFSITEQPIEYHGYMAFRQLNKDRLIEFNHRHLSVLSNYDLTLDAAQIVVLDESINGRSNLGALRNRQTRESVIVAAALSALAVGLNGRGSYAALPKEQQTLENANELKRANDRLAAQVMAEVLQTTTDTLPPGEEILIESTITEGVRPKPGKEVGGNPTIAVGALFGKKAHRSQYGMPMSPNVTLLSMGNDVIDGTTKSVTGEHSSLTALFLTESNVKRHLPDIYVQRWAAGADFGEINPRDVDLAGVAELMAKAYGHSGVEKLSAFFLKRSRHEPAMDALNKIGVATPYDTDGDLFPCLLLGHEGIQFPDGRELNAFIGEIGGSAEWAVGVLPLVWRGGQAIGMMTSQSTLTRSNMSPEKKWNERFHFSEDEFMMIQDARFEQKPFFSIRDILEDPFMGGISAFGSITDNAYLPFMKGVEANSELNTVTVWTLVINSLGQMEAWEMHFKANNSLKKSIALIASPKEQLFDIDDNTMDKRIGAMLDDPAMRRRFRIFFNNEYYPALIPVNDRLVLLHRALDGLIERGALSEVDRRIVGAAGRLAPEWFVPHKY
jgi:fructose-1,6-bisphosphatase/sedoheptulose 1,7-bisphosphatase-like protein